MKYSGLEVFMIVNALKQADSMKGQGRQFLRTNMKRFGPSYAESIGWCGDYEDEYDELTVQKNQADEVVAFHFDTKKSIEGYNAFIKHLSEVEYDIEPYTMTEDVLDFLEGVGMAQEEILMHLTTDFVQKRREAQAEKPTDEE
jgi:hypothetical protein